MVGTINCPPGYEHITTLRECQWAAAELGRSSKVIQMLYSNPKGCYVKHMTVHSQEYDSYFFNSHTRGSPFTGNHQPVCIIGMIFAYIQ